ncbi:MAG: carboxypeptidase-like regulatory domain-containing protein [Actinomycetota bacterium]
MTKGFRIGATVALLALTVALPARAQDVGNIYGGVTGKVGALKDICVSAWADDATVPTYQAWTDDRGWYVLKDVDPGTYKVQFTDCRYYTRYLEEWGSGKPSRGFADPVSVPAGGGVRVDAQMVFGGSISGEVVDQIGSALQAICVHVFSMDGKPMGGVTFTDTGGGYEIGGLPAGEYTVYFYDCYDYAHYDQWYEGETSAVRATPVHVALGEETGNIDIVMIAVPWPDFGVDRVVVKEEVLRTGVMSLPVGTGLSRRIHVDVSNRGTGPDEARLRVWVTQPDSDYRVDLAEVSVALDPGGARRCDFVWNAVGVVGDVWVHASVFSGSDPNRANNESRVPYFVGVGGVGVGIGVQQQHNLHYEGSC